MSGLRIKMVYVKNVALCAFVMYVMYTLIELNNLKDLNLE